MTDTNSLSSASHPSRYFSWLITWGTLAEKTNPSGVLDLQFSTIFRLGIRYQVLSISTVLSLLEYTRIMSSGSMDSG